jgi:hypothetical protein
MVAPLVAAINEAYECEPRRKDRNPAEKKQNLKS